MYFEGEKRGLTLAYRLKTIRHRTSFKDLCCRTNLACGYNNVKASSFPFVSVPVKLPHLSKRRRRRLKHKRFLVGSTDQTLSVCLHGWFYTHPPRKRQLMSHREIQR